MCKKIEQEVERAKTNSTEKKKLFFPFCLIFPHLQVMATSISQRYWPNSAAPEMRKNEKKKKKPTSTEKSEHKGETALCRVLCTQCKVCHPFLCQLTISSCQPAYACRPSNSVCSAAFCLQQHVTKRARSSCVLKPKCSTHTSLFWLSRFKRPALLCQTNCIKPCLAQCNTGYAYCLATSAFLVLARLHVVPSVGCYHTVGLCRHCLPITVAEHLSTFWEVYSHWQQFSENGCPSLTDLTQCCRGQEHAKAFSLHHTAISSLHCNGFFACAHSAQAIESKLYNQWLQKAVATNNIFL